MCNVYKEVITKHDIQTKLSNFVLFESIDHMDGFTWPTNMH